MSKTGNISKKAIFALFLVHFSGDLYQSFIYPLFPIIRENFDLSLSQIGLITAVVTLVSFAAQPIIGILAERFRPGLFMVTGLLLSCVFIPLMGVVPWFELLIVITGLGALGSSMYHPTAAGMVHNYAGDRVAFSMSVFGLGGTIAFSLGPLIVTLFVVTFGLPRLPYMAVFGLAAVACLVILNPLGLEKSPKNERSFATLRKSMAGAWKGILLLCALASMRSLVDTTFRSFYPILYSQEGHGLVSVGLVLSIYVLGGSLSSMVFGHLADGKGYRFIFYISFGLSTPCLIWLINSHGWAVYAASFMSGFFLLATMFPTVALANQLVPEGKSLVSSLTMGLASGIGGILAPLIGKLAGDFGIRTVIAVVFLIPLLCLAVVHRIPDYRAQS